MYSTAVTLAQLRERIDHWIQEVGPDAPVGVSHEGNLKDILEMEWVVINEATGDIVGTEADDYEQRKQPGEVNAIRFF